MIPRLQPDEHFDPIWVLFPCRFKVHDQTATSRSHSPVAVTPYTPVFEPESFDTGGNPVFMDISVFTLHFWMSDLSIVEASHQGSLGLPLPVWHHYFFYSISNVHISISPCPGCEERWLPFLQAESWGEGKAAAVFSTHLHFKPWSRETDVGKFSSSTQDQGGWVRQPQKAATSRLFFAATEKASSKAHAFKSLRWF